MKDRGPLPFQAPLIVVIALIALLPLAPVASAWITSFNYIGLFALVALGLVLLIGSANMLSFGQAAFVGLGAYTTALVTTLAGLSPWLGLVLGWLVTGIAAYLIGLITRRLSGHYLAIATMAVGMAIYFAFANLEVLGKNDGLNALPHLSILGFSFERSERMYYVIWGTVALAALGVRNLLSSRIGRAMRALALGDTMPEANGIDTARLKVLTFVLAALLASTSGWLYAHLQRAVSPIPFGLTHGTEYVFMTVLGGASSVWGAILGAGLFVLLDDVLRNLLPRLLGGDGHYELVALGVMLIVILQRARDGLWPFLARRMTEYRLAEAPAQAPVLPARPRPAPGEPVLEARGLQKRFGGLVAVSNVSFDIKAGEILALIGPNGAGKSTTFDLVTSVQRLSAGEVSFRGTKISDLPSRAVFALGVGRTFQHANLLPNMSVLENAALGAHLRGDGHAIGDVLASASRLNRAEERKLLHEAAKQLDRVGLGDSLYTAAGNLALGQQRLAEIARALCGDPTLLLLDEPAAGLRYFEKVALSSLLHQLRSEGMSILLVEHDMEFLMELADRVIVMDFGRLIASGTPEQVQNDPAVRRAYLGD
ncbi:MAG: branched-chain amino acid ABC transporter ATP-binding protein/permease [Xanthobacteraceae bacterium]|nr:branched-chain amino acid ABC transporter ATP-binding protein/permease [Xanthobacteraceae bacterium]